jgi:hypothetical protein
MDLQSSYSLDGYDCKEIHGISNTRIRDFSKMS